MKLAVFTRKQWGQMHSRGGGAPFTMGVVLFYTIRSVSQYSMTQRLLGIY